MLLYVPIKKDVSKAEPKMYGTFNCKIMYEATHMLHVLIQHDSAILLET
jgi:hypothetical protein